MDENLKKLVDELFVGKLTDNTWRFNDTIAGEYRKTFGKDKKLWIAYTQNILELYNTVFKTKILKLCCGMSLEKAVNQIGRVRRGSE